MMKTLWTVNHDPLQLLARTGNLSSFETSARIQGEDLVQVVSSATDMMRILDLGWYGDRYRVVLIDGDWDHPLEVIERPNLTESISAFREIAARF